MKKERVTRGAKVMEAVGRFFAMLAVGCMKGADWYDEAAPAAGRAVRRTARNAKWAVDDVVDTVVIWTIEEGMPRATALWWDAKGLASETGLALATMAGGARRTVAAVGSDALRALAAMACVAAMAARQAWASASGAVASGWEWRRELYLEANGG